MSSALLCAPDSILVVWNLSSILKHHLFNFLNQRAISYFVISKCFTQQSFLHLVHLKGFRNFCYFDVVFKCQASKSPERLHDPRKAAIPLRLENIVQLFRPSERLVSVGNLTGKWENSCRPAREIKDPWRAVGSKFLVALLYTYGLSLSLSGRFITCHFTFSLKVSSVCRYSPHR